MVNKNCLDTTNTEYLTLDILKSVVNKKIFPNNCVMFKITLYMKEAFQQ